MKAVISSRGTDLNSEVDERFGRCKYFLIVDIDTLKFDAISNESMMASGGAGIQAAQTVIDSGANLVITGQMGPNAFQTLASAEVSVITGAAGAVKDVIDDYKKGKLKITKSPTVGAHAGMGGGGMGMGRGGRGGGRGLGRGGR